MIEIIDWELQAGVRNPNRKKSGEPAIQIVRGHQKVQGEVGEEDLVKG